MCGISGFILAPGERADEALSRAMGEDIAHRGPDAQTGFTRGHFSFAHRRLKIIDVSDASNQPLFNEAGDVAVVYNGEIYNFPELRTELQGLGHQFRTRSDTEVVVHAFEEWGTAAFSRFNGMFAFALWDGRHGRDEFYLVRDKTGIKPLFYAGEGRRIGFASEVKPLLRLPWVKREVNHQALFLFLKFSHVPHPHTLLNGVSQLDPAHFLHVTSAGIAKKRYWDSRVMAAHAPQPGSLAEWEDLFETTLRDTVRRQAVSDVPVGCFLSGGIDSSLLTAAFTRHQGQNVQTFSVGYAEKAFDETSHAKLVANAFGTDHHEIIVRPEDFRDLVPEIPRYFDLPLADPSMLPTMLLSRLARSKVTVALSGDGADELFWGYDYQQILRHVRPLVGLPAPLRKGVFEGLRVPFGAMSDRARKLFEILQFRNEGELFQYFVGTVGPLRMDRLAALVLEDVSLDPPAFAPLVEQARGMSWNDKIAFVFQNTFLVDTVLAKTDRASMAYGLESRVPFLDDEMLALSARMPFAMKYRDGQSKFLLRSVLAKYLPRGITQRPKQGFSVPLQSWLRKELKYLLDDHVYCDQGRLADWLDMARVRHLADDHVAGRRNHSHLLWSVICLSLWKERYIGA